MRIHSRFAVIAPCIFTAARMASGFLAVIATFERMFDYATIAIAIALICDALDGKIARLLGSASEFGTQLDSLADVLAFGMAPAVLAFYWGVRLSAGTIEIAGLLACCTFVVCAAFRLARFNTTPARADGSRRFAGLPTPGAAGVIAAVVHFVARPLSGSRETAVWIVLILLLALLMVSRIPYYASNWIPNRLRKPYWIIPITVAVVALLWTHSGATLLALATVFVLSGPLAATITTEDR